MAARGSCRWSARIIASGTGLTETLRRRGARRRQRRTVRGAERPGARRLRRRGRGRAAASFAAATAATRATCARCTMRPTALLTDAYTEDEYVCRSDARHRGPDRTKRWRAWSCAARRSVPAGCSAFGVRLQPPLRGTLHLDRTNVLLSRRRQGADEQLLRRGRAAGRPRAVRRRRRRRSISRTAVSSRCR